MGELITLRQESGSLGLTATIDTTGAWVTSLTNFEDKILFPRSKVLDQLTLREKTRGGMHICSPYFGWPEEIIGEQDLPQHGFSRAVEWENITAECAETKGLPWNPRELCVLQYTQESGLYGGLGQRLVYLLSDEMLSADLTMRNGSDTPMTVAPGFHPYFYQVRNRSIKGLRAVEHRKGFPGFNEDVGELTLGPGFISSTDEEREEWEYEYRVEVSAQNLPVTVEWTDASADYFCVEPTMAGAHLNPTMGAQVLKPGEVTECSIAITVSC